MDVVAIPVGPPLVVSAKVGEKYVVIATVPVVGFAQVFRLYLKQIDEKIS